MSVVSYGIYEIPQLLKNPMSRYTFKRKLKAHLLNELAVF